MATLVLQAAGQAVGGFLGGPVGAMLGRAAGGIAGSVFDQALFGPGNKNIQGPRFTDLQVLSSSQGAPIPKVYGRVRIAGQVIWATRFEEVASTSRQRSGGKGSIVKPKTKITEYAYYANFAIGLAQGEINSIGRVWADGKELDISQFTWRLYKGTQTQEPDSLIVAKQGVDNAPSYRGTAYIVFENLPLERFGNRLPQLSFEVFKALDDVEELIPAVNIIPGSTEFGYDTQIVNRTDGFGGTVGENVHASAARSDWSVSLDQLQDACANISKASLVVAWFGDDLRCGNTLIEPRLETNDKVTMPHNWGVSGRTRASAKLVSKVDGDPAFGSTPDDGSVVRAITDLKARGLQTVFYPFIMMDIPSDNALPNPYDLAQTQSAYPWRGRITCSPAPGQNATPDKTSAIDTQVSSFFGNAQASDFQVSNNKIIYTGATDWGYRRMILRYAHLCALAGGVDAFLIGSELRGLTQLRDDQSAFPTVSHLIALANDVAQILPQAKISYAADWSEYFGYHPSDGSGDVFFHLDDLWASPDIDFVGIDNYMPLSDWRDGYEHLDLLAGASSIYDQNFLQGNIAGGEGFDWYYASTQDRENQTRTPITDGAYNKPWVYRFKDLKSWWSQQHFNRPAGVQSSSSTSWVPQSKPFWFTEVGCPAVDKSTNQPNVFVDPKSIESQLPYFSQGSRDDYIQRCYIKAMVEYWGTSGAHNPVSGLYSGPMVGVENLFVWAWDARPFPAFPALKEVWSDGENYQRGHWINGRMGAAPLAQLVGEILTDFDFDAFDSQDINGVIDGYVIDRPMSARQALETLSSMFSFDAVETQGMIKFRRRDETVTRSVLLEDMVELNPDHRTFELTRAQETDLPNHLKMLFLDASDNYQQASVDAQKLTGTSRRELLHQVPVVISRAAAQTRATISLHEMWSARETISFSLPMSFSNIEVGDVLSIPIGQHLRTYRVNEVIDGAARAVTAVQVDHENYSYIPDIQHAENFQAPQSFGQPLYQVLSLPLLNDQVNPYAPWIAARALPWPGSLALLENTGGSYSAIGSLEAASIMGVLESDLASGPLARIDRANRVRVKLFGGELSSISHAELLNGGNLIAIGTQATGWEIVQCQDAVLVGNSEYELSTLLRGQLGSDDYMLPVRPVGSTCVLLDPSISQIATAPSDIGRTRQLRLGPSSLDHANDAFVQFDNEPEGLALRPLSPVHLRAKKFFDHLKLSWVRRTRVDGDSWALLDVPLGEESETYFVEILSDDTPTKIIVRTMQSQNQNLVYSDVHRQADFAHLLPQSITFRVAQLSQTYGLGSFTESTIYV